MQTNQSGSGTQHLGDVITAAFDMSTAVVSSRATASELAARHLERVLARGGNARLVAALRDLASELAPPRVRASRPKVRRLPWAPARLAVAR